MMKPKKIERENPTRGRNLQSKSFAILPLDALGVPLHLTRFKRRNRPARPGHSQNREVATSVRLPVFNTEDQNEAKTLIYRTFVCQ